MWKKKTPSVSTDSSEPTNTGNEEEAGKGGTVGPLTVHELISALSGFPGETKVSLTLSQDNELSIVAHDE